MPTPPILVIAFNRPLHAAKILDAIREAKPDRIYIAIDGPRVGNSNDIRSVDETKKVFDGINWPCKVVTLYRESNLGCKIAVSSAITWFFSHEESGIILEDDCLPSKDFFIFCEDMLRHYNNDRSIMHINGVNFQDSKHRGSADYYFSKVCHVWGWATWRRAWELYDIELTGIEKFFSDDLYKSILNYEKSRAFWEPEFINTKKGVMNTWDYQWVFSIWKNNGLVIAPNYNLISNIGFDSLATHTRLFDKKVSARLFQNMPANRTYNDVFVTNFRADLYSFNKMFKHRNFLSRQFARVRARLHSTFN
jgi:hypothetical protein